jgi:hypothetical protein
VGSAHSIGVPAIAIGPDTPTGGALSGEVDSWLGTKLAVSAVSITPYGDAHRKVVTANVDVLQFVVTVVVLLRMCRYTSLQFI